ncbi:carboxypeptidase Taq [Marininema mesophilum]|uniref:Metal-dependent carboxypeptidase n=1 Tax=Marininema mesophilum TaxID=1048340 RepID=A0A1H2ZY38_9BACL|nr:carboxypeptidase M32 [Marininema mesophilum]SDX22306.1 carboxypeptidase Taq [Marininema mesophilum]
MQDKLKELKSYLSEVYDLNNISALLNWDQNTFMPKGGATARGRQLGLMEKIAHEKKTDREIGRLLDELASYEKSLPVDSQDAAVIRVARRQYEKAVQVPASFMAEMVSHLTDTYQVWVEARSANDFTKVQSYLEKTLDYSRQYAEYFPHEHIADPLIDDSDEGMTVEVLRPLFSDLRKQLVPLVKAIAEQDPVDDSCLKKHFPEQEQWKFGLDVIRQLGYDFDRGRLDKTHHPFMTKFSLGDVRITTRVKENNMTEALFSSIHETGHALYEQGISMNFEGTPLAQGASSGVHESQSRLWENIVGRSYGFWKHFYPKLQATFPEQFRRVSLDTFYRAINKVEPSLIRTDADELTYNLHVMIRFDLELDLLEGRLAVKDLPEAWRERYKSDIGVFDPKDADGVLQDVHWYFGNIGGAFQGYTLGNILSAQFYDAALRAKPNIPNQIQDGEFGVLHGWLKENLYQYGSQYTAADIVKRATGSDLTVKPYLAYLQEKFGKLYSLK